VSTNFAEALLEGLDVEQQLIRFLIVIRFTVPIQEFVRGIFTTIVLSAATARCFFFTLLLTLIGSGFYFFNNTATVLFNFGQNPQPEVVFLLEYIRYFCKRV